MCGITWNQALKLPEGLPGEANGPPATVRSSSPKTSELRKMPQKLSEKLQYAQRQFLVG
jgi:hypothetical protein